MENVILTIHLILAVALIGAVLLQRSEGGGLGIGGGGGGGGIMSGRSAATALSKVTWFLAIGFVVTSLTLTIVAAKKQTGASVVETLGSSSTEQTPDTTLPAALKDNLTPPVDTGAPATPPPVK